VTPPSEVLAAMDEFTFRTEKLLRSMQRERGLYFRDAVFGPDHHGALRDFELVFGEIMISVGQLVRDWDAFAEPRRHERNARAVFGDFLARRKEGHRA
jgi:hypothetical protein